MSEDKLRAHGGYFNVALLIAIAIYISFKSYERYVNPTEILTMGMIVIAIVGGVLNYFQHLALEHGHKKEVVRYSLVFLFGVFIFFLELVGGKISGSLSLEADAWHVFTDNAASVVSIVVASMVPERHDKNHVTHDSLHKHVLGDIWQSVAIVFGGVIIYFTNLHIIDILLSVAMSILLIYWAWDIFSKIKNNKYVGGHCHEHHEHHHH